MEQQEKPHKKRKSEDEIKKDREVRHRTETALSSPKISAFFVPCP